MSNTLHGAEAIAHVENAEGPLSSIERVIVQEEGYSPTPYLDTKGIPTVGVGQTGAYATMSAKEAIASKTEEARKLIPSFDTLDPETQAQLVSSSYRGDLGLSPKAVSLFNAGKYAEASEEYLNNDEYQTTPHAGIRRRMENTANAMRNLGLQEEAQTEFNQAQEPQIDATPRLDTATPTTGESKMEELERRNTIKQQELQKTSETKKLKTAGMTDAELKMLEMPIQEYAMQDIDSAGARVSEYLDAQYKLDDITQALNAASDPLFTDLDDGWQYAGNTALSTLNTIGRIAGGVLSLGPQLRAGLNLTGVSEEDMQMYNQIQGRSEAVWSDEEYEWYKDNQDVITDIQDAEESFGFADTINSVTGVLQPYINQELTTDFVNTGADIYTRASQGEMSAGEIASELTSLFTDNPGALGQSFVESLPYLFAVAYSLPATIASSWSSNQQEAINKYKEDNEGELPTEAKLAKMTGLTGAQALVDMLGDKLVTGGTANLRRAVAAMTGKAVVGKSALKAAGRVGVSGVGEFVAEGGAEVLG